MSGEKRIIKKYPNRRLYDTATSSYITLGDVKQLVLDHVELQVVDANTYRVISGLNAGDMIASDAKAMLAQQAQQQVTQH